MKATAPLPSFSRLLRDPVLLLAFGFGSGLAPRAPGTAGSLVALALAAGLQCSPFRLPTSALWWLLGSVVAAGVVICGVAARRLGAPDHPGIVWDEFAGLWLTLLLAPAGTGWWVAGFVLFRIFDIVKPWPIAGFDRRCKGGLGIMADDLVAGLFAGLTLRLAEAAW
ncbi:MAG: phosphatidylglycerophosphatase A [Porticoccaceae bacterium]